MEHGGAARASGSRPIAPEHAYVFDPAASISCGFDISSIDVVAAVQQSNLVMGSLPLSLYRTIDLKTQSGVVGAIFASELASRVGAIPNPIEKGHPDIVPPAALGATEAQLRNYPDGLEIKSTLGTVATGSALGAGEARINVLKTVVWQAHHRDVRSLMGLLWDFVEGTKTELRHPVITAVFYTDRLEEDDWGAIAGTTGRNTKVTAMKVSGRRKMGEGAIAVLDAPKYPVEYARCLGIREFTSLSARST